MKQLRELPQLTLALDIIQSAKSLGLKSLPAATLKRLANLLKQLPPQQKLCVLTGISAWFDQKKVWKS